MILYTFFYIRNLTSFVNRELFKKLSCTSS